MNSQTFTYDELIEVLNRKVMYEEIFSACSHWFPGISDMMNDLCEAHAGERVRVDLDTSSGTVAVLKVLYTNKDKFQCMYVACCGLKYQDISAQRITIVNPKGILTHNFYQDEFSRTTFEIMLNQINAHNL